MRSQLALAMALLLGLHLLGDQVAPSPMTAAEIPAHLGQTVQLEGTVLDVDPGRTVHRVELQDASGTTTVLLRGRPPPVGARLSLVGDLEADRDGAIVWARGAPTLLEVPSPAPRSLGELLERAPRLIDQPVAVLASWDAANGTLVDGDKRLPVRWRIAEPSSQDLLAWGLVTYRDELASYRLEIVGWRPWTQASSRS